MKKIKRETRNTTVFIVLRFLVVLTAVLAFVEGNWNNVFVCILTLILFTIPKFIEKNSDIDLPDLLESLIYLFIFSAQILGEIQNFYGLIPHWDTILHTINGFLFAGIGFSLVELLNKNDKTKIYLSPMYVGIVAFCFSVTIGTVWEFFEYYMDMRRGQDMQKDVLVTEFNSVYINELGENDPVIIEDIYRTRIEYGDDQVLYIENGYLDLGIIDTMDDMLVNAIGAIVFSIIGALYITDKDQYEFAKHFIPVKKPKEKK